MNGPLWVEFDVDAVMSMPAIGFEAIVTVGAGTHRVPRPWFSWTGRNWVIDVELWRDGMIAGFRAPWTPGALAELLKGASPTSISDELLPLGTAIERAAGGMELTLGQLPRRLTRGGASAVVRTGLAGADVALVASEKRMVVVTGSRTLQWFFQLAASGFTYEAAELDRAESLVALKLLSPEHVSRIMPNQHVCISTLRQNRQTGPSR